MIYNKKWTLKYKGKITDTDLSDKINISPEISQILNNRGIDNEKDAESIETAWNALKASSQEPNPEDVTSNTQWSIVFSNTDKKADIALRRHWDLITSCTL